ncbi:large-conductance mechanosensitive channel protein MscL [Brevibacterium sp. 50QC2O2]|uniref:large-conductance mechanosensitive channel protein MscL n=1 Tax=Brevibacterium TaxID=1696 RepID=UPI00211B99CC|nr:MULTISPECIES: large-conductance mechanosensitive channel protein MscL [unclassified Brevibacterium]MCQ9369557.1 large-conductance mechanosensitive channel protein MscL [Brevibacterium sp. 91QC2O2]MCQ9385161.1 large-conductance mechanosensitive channel protein MscL [Brevibacterium sp. 68QC2CO]MCQ9387784.1 large-conductance mechanosensitive channel protein MscL [Brevibacterium sp. 50QC2O2]
MFKGFKEFILRGNVIELAVGVIIGGAFTAIVTAITDKIINPLIAAIGSPDMGGLGFHVRPGVDATFLDFGAVITAALNFLIIAAVVYFVIVMPMNKLANMRKRGTVDEEEVPPTSEELLAEIRDLLAANAKSNNDPQH